MSVCSLCGRLDFIDNFQEEARQLSWLSEDIAVLFKENSALVENIKKLNLELENFEEQTEFYDETLDEDDDCEYRAAADAHEMWRTCQEELNSLERDIWLQKEVHLRERLVQQVLTLSQDLSTLQHQQQSLQHHCHPHLPQHLWGHQTLQWPSRASRSRPRKAKQPGRLLRWIERRMPTKFRDLV